MGAKGVFDFNDDSKVDIAGRHTDGGWWGILSHGTSLTSAARTPWSDVMAGLLSELPDCAPSLPFGDSGFHTSPNAPATATRL